MLLITALHRDFASTDTLAALAIADVGVALDDPRAATPWSADIITGTDLAAAVRILSADGYQRRGPAAPDLAAYLALHDVHADIVMFQSVGNSVGAGLLAAARDFGCDLLAMGAYSHARLRQLILGAVAAGITFLIGSAVGAGVS